MRLQKDYCFVPSAFWSIRKIGQPKVLRLDYGRAMTATQNTLHELRTCLPWIDLQSNGSYRPYARQTKRPLPNDFDSIASVVPKNERSYENLIAYE